mmetsp:Transcript_100597/g.289043  ORF Transcript_100597/g.289043 Transcript_100597/m.289043 type:complete len:203 (+) Transcript_100597:951-1559(+)
MQHRARRQATPSAAARSSKPWRSCCGPVRRTKYFSRRRRLCAGWQASSSRRGVPKRTTARRSQRWLLAPRRYCRGCGRRRPARTCGSSSRMRLRRRSAAPSRRCLRAKLMRWRLPCTNWRRTPSTRGPPSTPTRRMRFRPWGGAIRRPRRSRACTAEASSCFTTKAIRWRLVQREVGQPEAVAARATAPSDTEGSAERPLHT